MNSSLLSRALFLALFFFLNYAGQAQNEVFQMSQIGSNFLLDKPWDLLYGPDDYLWVTERTAGVVVRINPETAERDELVDIPDCSSTAGQDGLLGMALHSDFLGSSPYLYLSYTHLVGGQRKQKIVRYTYSISGDDGTLSDPVILLDNLPASNDHNSGRMVFGPDGMLYYTIGDQGANQSSNYCNPNLAQVLPTQQEVLLQVWDNYPGSILRIDPSGAIPMDNPMLDGVRSHIYSYGHRNAQGIVFGSNGLLYADEHGPNTDDEVNVIYSGMNYGWPRIAGYQDDQVYDYCNWSSAPNCQSLSYSSSSCPPTADFLEESTFSAPNYQEPLLSMFAVPDDYNFNDPACDDSWICRPNVAPSSIAYYDSDAIPSWQNSLLVSSLKRGRIFRLLLDADGTAMVGDTIEHFYTTNRYRDIVVSPDGKSFFMITDESGKTSGPTGLTVTTNLQNPGAILKFTLDETSAVQQPLDDSKLRVWPNPTSQSLFFELKAAQAENPVATLVDATGAVIQRLENLQTGVNEVDVTQFPTGVYLLRIQANDQTWQKRVVLF
ncbi:MAG: PQQ-dependent sugar dehydrogenase [Phaeodactylibacter sp.]|nr:PQQ-dependent sugar dehydrogenase [Phaeodactylibacter sp.]